MQKKDNICSAQNENASIARVSQTDLRYLNLYSSRHGSGSMN